MNCNDAGPKRFDIERYAGKWYEVMRLPIVWQTDCKGATAEYGAIPGTNSISVNNTCLGENGEEIRTRLGRADYVREDEEYIFPVEFKISFDETAEGTQIPAFIKDLNVGTDQPYWIEYTDYDNFAVVGGPTRQYVWLLSREPQVSMKDVKRYSYWLKRMGYDSSKFILWGDRLSMTDYINNVLINI